MIPPLPKRTTSVTKEGVTYLESHLDVPSKSCDQISESACNRYLIERHWVLDALASLRPTWAMIFLAGFGAL